MAKCTQVGHRQGWPAITRWRGRAVGCDKTNWLQAHTIAAVSQDGGFIAPAAPSPRNDPRPGSSCSQTLDNEILHVPCKACAVCSLCTLRLPLTLSYLGFRGAAAPA